MICEYCGGDHPIDALCQPRLTISRRAFLFLGLGTVVSAMLPSVPAAPDLFSMAESEVALAGGVPGIAAWDPLFKQEYMPLIVNELNSGSIVQQFVEKRGAGVVEERAAGLHSVRRRPPTFLPR